jgi:hypothetical protein
MGIAVGTALRGRRTGLKVQLFQKKSLTTRPYFFNFKFFLE